MALTHEQTAQCVARELRNGYHINLGIGVSTLVASYAPEGTDVMLQSEGGLLGMSAFPSEVEVDIDMINAGKQTVTVCVGASIFDSVQSFATIRGGHVDLTMSGAFEVDVCGNTASRMTPGKLVKDMSGVMDLVTGAKNIIVITTHVSKNGESKLLPYCTLPLTGRGRIRKVLTDLAYLEIEDGAFILRECAPGVSVEEIVAKTAGKLTVPEHVLETSLWIAARMADTSTQGAGRADHPFQRT